MYFIKQKEKKYGHKLWLYIFAVTLANALGVASVVPAMAQSDVKFNEGVRYSQWVIDSRLGDFYGNTNDFGFTTYNRDNLSVKKEVTKWKNGSTNPYIDYVPGLVAKATIEAAEYYKNFDWAKPWFKSVEWYGNKCTVPTEPDNLDAINASKMYFGIYALANGSFSSNAESTTASKATTQLGNALSALKHYNETYAFPASTTLNGKDIAGGWYHKSIYPKQMWLDGQYMGPALLAQLINGYSSYSSNKLTDNDWNLITKQFTIVWEQCWDDKEKLLYHAFSSEALSYWTSDAEIWTTAQTDKTKWKKMDAAGHSSAFWGRAEGWYFLALVDVLEQMPTKNANYNTLKNYLTTLADGIKARQDATSGCWYQLVGKDKSYTASYYNGNPANPKTNYLESSCTAIFAAAYLKAVRLGLLSNDYKTIGENAYKGAVAQFMKQRTDGSVDLLGCCKSAGVGTVALGEEKFRDGSNAYYLHGYDVAPTSTTSNYYTEGKVMGAFIMAATEYERANQKDIRFSYDLAPTYTLEQGGSITAEALGSGDITYKWYNASNDSPVSGAASATFTPTESGSYYCKATNGSTTIQTSTTVVTVSGTSNENVGNEVQGDVPLVTLPSTEPTDITCNGTASTINNSDYLMYKQYCYTLSNGATCTLTIPSGVTVSKIEIYGTSSDNSNKSTITISNCTPDTGGELNTRKSASGASTLTFTPTSQQSTYTITSGNKGSYIQIKVYGTTGSSTEPTPSTDASATFTYNGSPLSFTENVATINLASSQANSNITVNADPANGATITTSSENTSISDNVITITAPAAGSNANYVYTVTAEDGTTTKTYTINVSVAAAPVLYTVTFNAGTNGTCSTASLTQESQGASITLPDVTANEGYTFDGWYTTAEDGNKVESPYTPTANTTLYAHYSEKPSGGGETGIEQTTTIDVDHKTNEVVTLSGDGSWDGSRESGYYYGLSNKTGGSFTIASKNPNVSISKIVLTYTADNSDRYGGTVTVETGKYSYSPSDIKGTWTGSANSVTFTTTKKFRIKSIEVTYLTGPAINIATQPVDATFAVGTSEGSISVVASANNEKSCSYQWYKCDDTSKTNASAISGATNASYSPDKATAGTYYYYCIVKAAGCEDVTTNVATVTVKRLAVALKFTDSKGNAKWEWNETRSMPTFSQPTLKAYVANEDGTASATEITIKEDFSSKVKYISDVTSVATVDETTGEIKPVETGNGEAYVYAKFAGNDSYEPAETYFTVSIVQGYSLKINNRDTAPAVNSSTYITDNADNKLVKITYGGWKYNSGKYTVNGNEYTDSWNAAAQQSGVSAFDGYDSYIIGVNDAKDEKREASDETIYGSTRYGWFKSPTKDSEGNITETYPYTLPVRGSYMTFEPKQNGTLTVYILQNGAWNVFDSETTVDGVTYKKGDIKPGEFRPHSFHVVNQRGITVSSFSPLSFKAATKQKVADGYKCIFQDEEGYDAEDKKNVVNWNEFAKYLSENEQQKIHDAWSNDLGYQSIVELDNGSFLAIQKGIVKYTFFVTANETYYLFSNFSKIGFAGANFVPSTNVSPSDVLTLSDVEAYPTPVKVTDDENKYAWKFGDEIKGYVPGFTIPLFSRITLNRKFTAKQWTTLTLPFNLTEEEVQRIFGEGTELITLDNVEDNDGYISLHFLYHEIQNVLPGNAYLINPAKEVTSFTVTDKPINPNIEQQETVIGNYTFKGVDGYSKANLTNKRYSEQLDKGDIFVSDGNGKLYISKGSSYVKGYRAYIDFNGTTPAKGIKMDYSGVDDSGENTTTSINIFDLSSEAFNALQLKGVYNTQGQKVADTTEGLPTGVYISNGKKIIVK